MLGRAIKVATGMSGPVVAGVVLAAMLVGLSACGSAPTGRNALDPRKPDVPTAEVTALAETAHVAGSDDALADPAIWVAPDSVHSLIFGADKRRGLYIYGLDGTVKQTLPVGRLSSVDLRDGFPWQGRNFVLAVAADRTNQGVAIFLMDPLTRVVAQAPGSPVSLNISEPSGVCLMRGQDGSFTAAVSGGGGNLVQLSIHPAGKVVAATVLRHIKFDSALGGCVFDDRTDTLYVSEAQQGIWRLPADPAAGDERAIVQKADKNTLKPPLAGLTIYPRGRDGGWLIASCQGDSTLALFQLPEGRFSGRFQVIKGPTTDAITKTEGIDATARPLSDFAGGVVVAQDGEDDKGGQNFKLIDWYQIAWGLKLAR
jgi:3-phytase